MPDKFLPTWKQKEKKIAVHAYNSFSDRRTVYTLKIVRFSLSERKPDKKPSLKKKVSWDAKQASESC